MPCKAHSNPQLAFVEEAALQPAEVNLDAGILQQNKQEFREARSIPLPPEEDEDI